MDILTEGTIITCAKCEWLGPVSSLSRGHLGKRKNTEAVPFSCPDCGTAIVERKGEEYSPLLHCRLTDLKSKTHVELTGTLLRKVGKGRATQSTKIVLDEIESRAEPRKRRKAT